MAIYYGYATPYDDGYNHTYNYDDYQEDIDYSPSANSGLDDNFEDYYDTEAAREGLFPGEVDIWEEQYVEETDEVEVSEAWGSDDEELSQRGHWEEYDEARDISEADYGGREDGCEYDQGSFAVGRSFEEPYSDDTHPAFDFTGSDDTRYEELSLEELQGIYDRHEVAEEDREAFREMLRELYMCEIEEYQFIQDGYVWDNNTGEYIHPATTQATDSEGPAIDDQIAQLRLVDTPALQPSKPAPSILSSSYTPGRDMYAPSVRRPNQPHRPPRAPRICPPGWSLNAFGYPERPAPQHRRNPLPRPVPKGQKNVARAREHPPHLSVTPKGVGGMRDAAPKATVAIVADNSNCTLATPSLPSTNTTTPKLGAAITTLSVQAPSAQMGSDNDGSNTGKVPQRDIGPRRTRGPPDKLPSTSSAREARSRATPAAHIDKMSALAQRRRNALRRIAAKK